MTFDPDPPPPPPRRRARRVFAIIAAVLWIAVAAFAFRYWVDG